MDPLLLVMASATGIVVPLFLYTGVSLAMPFRVEMDKYRPLGWFFILAGVAQWFGFCALVVWRVCA